MRNKFCFLICIAMVISFAACGKKEVADNTGVLKDIIIRKRKIEYDTAKAERCDLNVFLPTQNAEIIPINFKSIYMDYDVTIKYVDSAYPVKVIKKGDVVIEFDTTQIDEDIEKKKLLIEHEKKIYQWFKKIGKSQEEIAIKELDIKILNKQLDKLVRDRKQFKVYAETDCYIRRGSPVIGRKYEAGEFIIEVADNTRYVLRTEKDIIMTTLKNVKIGDQIHIMHGTEALPAEVSYIDLNENNRGTIYFELSEGGTLAQRKIESIKIGAKFTDLVLSNVLVVDTRAINGQEKYHVKIIKDGIRKMRYVRIGTSGQSSDGKGVIQIISGLKEGDEVVIDEKSRIDSSK